MINHHRIPTGIDHLGISKPPFEFWSVGLLHLNHLFTFSTISGVTRSKTASVTPRAAALTTLSLAPTEARSPESSLFRRVCS